MVLSKYIHNLLYRYECVIIPDFGGFLTKTVSAQLDEKSHTLHPPSKRLGFNSQLTESDGLLVNYIATVDKIPYKAAVNFVKLEVESLKEKLIFQDVTLEGVGTFTLTFEKKLLFEPDSNANFLTDSFGLTSLVAPSVFRLNYMNEEVIFESISDVLSTEEIYVNTRTIKRGATPFYRYAAIFAMLLTIGYFLGKQIINNNKLGKQVAELEADQEALMNKRIQEATFEINKTLPAITITARNERSLEKTLDETTNQPTEKSEPVVTEVKDVKPTTETVVAPKETSTKSNTIPKATSNNTTNLKYHIIAGAFSDPANATKKVAQLEAKGYSASIVGINKWQLTQVAFGSYATKEEAQVALKEIQKTASKDAWLLVK